MTTLLSSGQALLGLLFSWIQRCLLQMPLHCNKATTWTSGLHYGCNACNDDDAEVMLEVWQQSHLSCLLSLEASAPASSAQHETQRRVAVRWLAAGLTQLRLTACSLLVEGGKQSIGAGHFGFHASVSLRFDEASARAHRAFAD